MMRKKHNILILTEGGKKIGHGHLVRCSALYQAFREEGALPVVFVNGDDSLRYLLKGKNYRIFDWLHEKERLLKEVSKFDLVVIDSYLAPKSLYDEMSRMLQGKILIIDDFNRINYPNSLVVCPSIYGRKIKYPKKDGIEYLLGREFIILRKEFWSTPRKSLRRNIRNVLIVLGGSDCTDYLKMILGYLTKQRPKIIYHVVAPNVRLKRWPNTYMYNNLSALEMRRLMLRCDLSISAGGQTLYELIKIGLPVIAVCLAENQLFGLLYFTRMKLIQNVGWVKNKTILPKLGSSFDRLLNYEERMKMIRSNKGVIDGQGAKRVVEKCLGIIKERVL